MGSNEGIVGPKKRDLLLHLRSLLIHITSIGEGRRAGIFSESDSQFFKEPPDSLRETFLSLLPLHHWCSGLDEVSYSISKKNSYRTKSTIRKCALEVEQYWGCLLTKHIHLLGPRVWRWPCSGFGESELREAPSPYRQPPGAAWVCWVPLKTVDRI